MLHSTSLRLPYRKAAFTRAQITTLAIVLLASLLTYTASAIPASTTIYVDVDASGSDSGSDWTNAYNDLQDALAAAGTDDEIWVAEGTYYPSTTDNPNDAFDLKDKLAIYGGFDGTETNRGQRDWTTHVTILSGDIGSEDFSSDNTSSIVKLGDSAEQSATVDGFTISGALQTAINVSPWPSVPAELTLANCILTDNASNSGAGGALRLFNDATADITNCTFTNNNSNSSDGGAIYVDRTASADITDSSFTNNNANNGGAIRAYYGGQVQAVRCTFTSNSATQGGAIAIDLNSSVTAINCTFTDNTAISNGGAIYTYYQAALSAYINCTFSGNTATNGGALYNDNQTHPTLTNCTLVGNTATNGGAVYNAYGSNATLTNTILWNNTPDQIDLQSSAVITVSYSIVRDGWTGATSADPLFVDADNDNFTLQAGSPAINTGSNAALPLDTADLDGDTDTAETLPHDLAGDSRIKGANVDIGAYEATSVIFVDTLASGLNNGSSWANAFNDLQDALEAVGTNDEIWVAAGTYYPSVQVGGTGDRYATFQLVNGIAIYGGFAGTETARDQRDVATNVTILSGDIGTPSDSTDNAYHVFYHPSTLTLDATATLDGVTITGGNADEGAYPFYNGGGMLNISSSPTITNCTFTSNYAIYGGAIANGSNITSASPTISNCTFTSNTAIGGGAINNQSSSSTITNCTFTQNATTTQGGGAIRNQGSSSTITNCTFTLNTTTGTGGAIYLASNATATITNSTFTENSASNGGAISESYVSSSSTTVISSTFTSNSATNSGGALYLYASDTFINCAFTQNTAGTNGGAVYGGGDYDGNITFTFTNCAFSRNSATGTGGALYVYVSSATITNCSLSQNTATNGGAILFDLDYESYTYNLTVRNSILWGNGTEIVIVNDDFGFGDRSALSSIVQSGTFQTGSDPLFADPANDNLRLQATSPARNSGNNADLPADTLDLDDDLNTSEKIPFDVAGSARIVDTTVDRGAFEYAPPYAGPIFYVDIDASAGGDGSAWTNAMNDLQDALSAAGTNDEIWVAEGTYTPTQKTDDADARTATFQLINGVGIYGGFNATETNRDQRDWETHITVLSGDIGTADYTDDNAYHVFYHPDGTNLDATAILDGVTITGGITQNSANNDGGGMSNYGSSPSIRNCLFTQNFALDSGGGLANMSSSHATVINCTFSGNSASNGGGGIYNLESSPTVINCTFTENSVLAGSGGAIRNYGSSSMPIITNCIFSQNSASFGGAIHTYEGSATVTNCTISMNSASFGGGIYNQIGTLTVENSILWGNGTEIQNASDPFGTATAIVNYSIVAGGWPTGPAGPPVPGPPVNVGILNADPLFIDADNGDFRLSGSSPAINTGSTAALPLDSADLDGDLNTSETLPYDLASNRRVRGLSVDMGAYESDALILYAPSATESETVICYVTRDSADFSAALTVDLTTSSTADATVQPTVTIPATQSQATFNMVYVDDGDDTATTQVALTATATGLAAATATVNIADNDPATLTLFAAPSTFAEDDGALAATGTVGRTVPYSTSLIVTLTSADTSEATVPPTVTFTAGSSTATFAITAVDDAGNDDGDKSFLLTAAADFYTSGTRTITVEDTDTTPTANPDTYYYPYGTAPFTVAATGVLANDEDIDGSQFSATIVSGPTNGTLNLNLNGGFTWTQDTAVFADSFTYQVTDTAGNVSTTTTVDLIASVLFVDADATAGTETGRDWANAFLTLQDALDVATAGDEIWIAEGTYYPSVEVGGTGSRYATFQLINNVAIYGGFDATETARDQRNWETHSTILSGDIGTPSDTTDNAYHVFYHPDGTDLDATSILDGVTITAGVADGAYPHNIGGAIFNDGSSPSIANSSFSQNQASVHGGAIYNTSASPAISNSSFTENSASWGGAIYNRTNCSPTITDCTFTDNRATSGGAGAIFVYAGSAPVITRSTFTDNSANAGGGAIGSESTAVITIISSTFSGNSSTSGSGGAIYSNILGTITVVNSLFYNNTDDTIVCTSTLDTLTITNCTIVDSNASSQAINSSATTTITNSIIWGNDSEINVGSSPRFTISHSIIDGGWTGDNNLDADPLFVDADNGDFRLLFGSPALEAGSNAALPLDTADLDGDDDAAETIPHDLNGKARVQFTTVDMGALEGATWFGPRYYVDVDATGYNIGADWTHAFNDLQDALDLAEAGDEIWIAEGTYKPSNEVGGDGDRYATFQMINGVAIYGGFNATETARDERDWETHITVLSGDIGTAAYTQDNAYHVFYHPDGTNLDNTAILDGVTITAGTADIASGDLWNGGGMYNYGSSPTLTNCSFSGNSARNHGGGIYNKSSSFPTLTNCSFLENSAGFRGGGMDNASSSPTLIDCSFSKNSAANAGGGMVNKSSSPTLINCTFSENSAPNTSGGMLNETSSSPILTNCTFTKNSANFGGAMYNSASSTPILTNCTFTKNSANSGGAMYNNASSSTLANCILWGDTATTGSEIHNVNGSSPTITYSIVQNGTTIDGNLDADPLFVDADNGDLTLLSGSPAINTGSTAALTLDTADLDGDLDTTEPIPFDLAGNTRAIGTVDMGAYEVQNVAPVAQPDSYTVKNDNLLTVATGGVLDNDTDADGDQMTATVFDDVDHGALTLYPDGTFTYFPSDGYVGGDAFTYTVSDGVATDTGTVEITVISAGRVLRMDDVSLLEADTDMLFTVKLSAASGREVTANYTTVAVTALADSDYTTTSGSITIAPGQVTTTIAIPIIEDNIHEADDTFKVVLSSPARADISRGTATGKILNDESVPVVSLSSSPSTIGEAGGEATFTATLSHPSYLGTSAYLAFSGTASSSEYSSPTALVVYALTTSRTITLYSKDDDLYEPGPDETVIVDIDSVTNGTENGTQQATLNITDNDAQPQVTLGVTPSSIAEAGGIATIRTTLSNPSTELLTVTLTYSGTAIHGDDYTASTTVIIPPLAEQATTTITAIDDGAYEPTNETVIIDIDGVTNGTEKNTRQVQTSIVDNDAQPTVSLSGTPATIAEAGGGATFTATLSGANNQPVQVRFTLSGTATIGDDYTASATSIDFPVGATTGTITITALDDSFQEVGDDETIIVDITGTTNTTEDGTQRAQTAIVDDEPSVLGLSISPSTVNEDAGPGAATGTVTRTQPWTDPLIVNLVSDDPTEAAVPTSVTILATASSATFPIEAIDDAGDIDGTATVTITATATSLTSASATLDVQDSGFSPVAVDDVYSFTRGTSSLTISTNGVLANDPTTGQITATILTQPANGTVTLNPDGTFTWTAATDTLLADSFTYRFTEISGRTSTAATVILRSHILLVDADATGDNDGRDWANAFTDLQSALTIATDANQIWVAEGTYKPGTQRDDSFQMIEGANLYGGFAGYETTVTQRDWQAHVTVLSGDIGTADYTADNSQKIVTFTNITVPTTLDGFTITDGYDDTTNPSTWGGAGVSIINTPAYSGSDRLVFIRNCLFTRNATDHSGGALGSRCSSAVVSSSTFRDNSAAEYGGAIASGQGNLSVSHCWFEQNTAELGGGAALASNTLSVGYSNCVFRNNTSSGNGGAIYASSSNIFILSSTLYGNTAAQGGAIFTGLQKLQISSSIITGNSPDQVQSTSVNVISDSIIQGGFAGTGILDVDPLFADAANGNFRLLPGSPAIDAGSASLDIADLDNDGSFTDPVPFDFASRPRLVGSAVDMGAYEFFQVLHVDLTATGTGSGSDWTNAHTTLQGALDVAQPGDEIWVAAGTYLPTAEAGGSGPRYLTFQLQNNVAIYGGFAGTESTRSERDLATNVTILSGDLGTPGDSSDNAFHVLYHPASSALDATAILDGVTITDGNANDTSAHGTTGGGIYNHTSSPTLANIRFTDNFATVGGAAMWNENSSPTVTQSVFHDNGSRLTAVSAIAAIINTNGSQLTLTQSSMTNNAGAILNNNATCTIANNIIWGNDSAITNTNGGTATVTYSVVQGGYAGTGNLDADPRFADAGNGDLTVLPASPAINVGSNAAIPADTTDVDGNGNTSELLPLDLAGNPRVHSTTVDMGAYEAANAAPTAIADTYTIGADDLLTITTGGVLDNDTDTDGNPLTATVLDDVDQGVLALATDGTFTYFPADGYTGPDSFTYTVSDGSASAIGTASITVNAVTRTLSIDDISKEEADTPYSFTVTLSQVSGRDVTVQAATNDGTAEAPADYIAVDALVTIPAGQLTATVDVTVKEDLSKESTETFTVTLVNPTRATLGTATGTGTITDDDLLPVVTLSVSATSITEAAGTVTIVATVSEPTSSEVTVVLATSGSATSSQFGLSSYTLTIAPLATTGSVELTATDNATYNLGAERRVIIDIDSVTNATENGTQRKQIDIVDNELPPATIDATVDGGPTTIAIDETAGEATVTFNLNNPSTEPTIFTFTLAGTAIEGVDYTVPSYQIIIPAGQTIGTLVITVLSDGIYEPGTGETIVITITSTGGATTLAVSTSGIATIAAGPTVVQYTLTIADTDPIPTVTIDDLTVNEAAGTATLSVTMIGLCSELASVDYATVGVTATTADDYTALDGTLSWEALTNGTKTITVPIVNDDLYETTETLRIDLDNGLNIDPTADPAGTITITDNESSVVVYKGRAGDRYFIIIGNTSVDGGVTQVHGIHWLEYWSSRLHTGTYKLRDTELALPAQLYDNSTRTAIVAAANQADDKPFPDSLLMAGRIRPVTLQSGTVDLAPSMRGNRLRISPRSTAPDTFDLVDENVQLRLNISATNYFLNGIASDRVAANAILAHYISILTRLGYKAEAP